MRYLFKYMRHKSIIKRMTWRRLYNCLLLCQELKARKALVNSSPVVARINTYPLCNLNCTACQRIASNTATTGTEMMTLSQYQEILDQLAPHLLLVVLYDEGEPLLHPQLPEIIRCTHSRNISTSISTNLAMTLSDDYLLDLMTSGLDRMTVSMDGFTQPIYGRYRIGGSVATLKENLERLLRVRKRTGSKTSVEVQFIDFGFNAHEMGDVKSYARRVGADTFRALPSSIYGMEEYLAHRGMTLTEGEHLTCGCLDLWSIAHISSDGRLFPCDFGEDNGMAAVGNVLREDFAALWNSPRMRQARAYFAGSDTVFDTSLCRRCPSANRAPWFLR
ncbi:radical SAM protein [Geomonas propionica]|uniref:Radical SAM protein n=1 Tax=Geomonas propionica TaxID=2798582 RepID=A0ABS0YPP0_9BACT|nr:radical SAM protein [Geomonas propionica]MBJ6799432.1 radical SAM protein [Geomonas propionica]